MKWILCLVLFSFSAFGQDAKPDQWRGLEIDKSSPVDAVAKLGKPKSEKVDRLRVYGIDRVLSSRIKEKKFKVLEFEKKDDVTPILVFENEKLVYIYLKIGGKQVSPNALKSIYGIGFEPHFDRLDMAFWPEKFQQDQGKTFARSYPVWYTLIGSAENSMVVAGVDNSSIASVLGTASVNNGTFPGWVRQVQIVSRTLENKDGANVLK